MSEGTHAVLLIVCLGVATYLTRIAGHLVLSRFPKLNPRVESALDAVPAAVLTAIAAPMALAAGAAEALAAGIVVVASLWLPIHVVLVIGVAAVAGLRAAGL